MSGYGFRVFFELVAGIFVGVLLTLFVIVLAVRMYISRLTSKKSSVSDKVSLLAPLIVTGLSVALNQIEKKKQVRRRRKAD